MLKILDFVLFFVYSRVYQHITKKGVNRGMSKTITIDDVTYDILKKQANYWGRTLAGHVKFIVSHCNMENVSTPVEPTTQEIVFSNIKTRKDAEIRKLSDKMATLDEESDEYKNLLFRIQSLQKGA